MFSYLFSTKVLIGDTMFMCPTGDRMAILHGWSSEPHEGLAILQGWFFSDCEYWSDSNNRSYDHLLYSQGFYWLPCYPHTELAALQPSCKWSQVKRAHFLLRMKLKKNNNKIFIWVPVYLVRKYLLIGDAIFMSPAGDSPPFYVVIRA